MIILYGKQLVTLHRHHLYLYRQSSLLLLQQQLQQLGTIRTYYCSCYHCHPKNNSIFSNGKQEDSYWTSTRLYITTTTTNNNHHRRYISTNNSDQYNQLRQPTLSDIEKFQQILKNNRPGTLIVGNHLKPTPSSVTTNNLSHDTSTIDDDDDDTDDTDTDSSILELYNVDWTKHYTSTCNVLVRPETTQQVVEILKYCSDEKIAIIPVGGKTNLVGATIGYTNNEIFVSLERLNHIVQLPSTTTTTTTSSSSTVDSIIACQAGCIVQTVQDYCNENNLLLPIDLGSKGTCQIGGVVSTNAGGSYYTRYGSIASNIVGIQVCLPNGTIYQYNYSSSPTTISSIPSISNVANVHKDNASGYKIHQLFVGAEGTLGIITGVAIKCYIKPSSKHVLFVKCSSYTNIQHTIYKAKQYMGEILAACEYMDSNIMNRILQIKYNNNNNSNNNPFQQLIKNNNNNNDDDVNQKYYYLLIETHGSNEQHDREKIDSFLSNVMEENSSTNNNDNNTTTTSAIVIDGILAQDMKQYNEFWSIREACNPTVTSLGYTYKYDISLPSCPPPGQVQQNDTSSSSERVYNFDDIIHLVQRRLDESSLITDEKLTIQIYTWGHVLDGNLHLNITTVGLYTINTVVLNTIEPYLYQYIINTIGGSISAEHGLGQCKNQYMSLIHNTTTLQLMQSIKTLFDPNHILNPGKFLSNPEQTTTTTHY